jgi:hypothetical protein
MTEHSGGAAIIASTAGDPALRIAGEAAAAGHPDRRPGDHLPARVTGPGDGVTS